MRHRLSASKIQLGRHCLAWANPEWKYKEPPTTRAANAGNHGHALIDEHISGRPSAVKFEASDVVSSMYGEWVKWYIGHEVQIVNSEVRYALDTNLLTARELPPAKYHRDYGDVSDIEVPGSADAVAVKDGIVHVYDWKCTTSPRSWNAQTTAEGNAQLEFLAACAANVHGLKEAMIYIVQVSQTSYAETPLGGVHLDEWALEETREEVRDMVRRLPLAEQNPGPWCTRQWCPAKKECKAFQGLKGAA